MLTLLPVIDNLLVSHKGYWSGLVCPLRFELGSLCNVVGYVIRRCAGSMSWSNLPASMPSFASDSSLPLSRSALPSSASGSLLDLGEFGLNRGTASSCLIDSKG